MIREIGLQLHHEVVRAAIDTGGVHQLVTALWHYVAQRYAAPAAERIRIGRLSIETVLDGFRDAIGNWDGVARMARRAGLSRSHFTRVVRARAGLSPYAFVRGSTIEAAKHLLERPSLSLADVAYRTGFSDQSHLTRVFRDSSGLTPARYRAHHRAARDP